MDVLELARAAAAEGPVCDACLGRVVADRSHGLGNAERGRSLRVAAALADDQPYEPVETADCWVCEGECARFDEWAERAAATVEEVEFATYQVGTRAPPLVEENERLFREALGLDPEAGEPFKMELNREVGKRVGRLTDTAVDFGRPDVQFLLDVDGDRVEATVNSTFVYGRYRKLERDIPQTEWPCRECHGSGYQGREPCPNCDGAGYLYETSVEESVAPVIEDVMDGTDATFHGAGREDVDARMLGTGRPFVVEVAEPRRRRVDVERLEADVNAFAEGRVEVDGLRLATYEMVERVKKLDASKRYRAEVAFDADVDAEAFENALAELSGATVEQYTPTRVDHRRASMTREREVYEATGELQDPRRATVEVHGAGGLYVKELVSGDEGRTEPSLAGLLGVGAEVTALDVLAVEGEDEPFERPEFFRDVPEDDVEGGGTGDGDGDDDGNGDGDGTEDPRGDDATADTAADESGSNRGTAADS
jgi:tRNA pseudouridine synthase 10